MNEIGKLLNETRIQHGLDIEQVARETNIARRYLEALENDDYSVFPAEPYVVGFLRNYCDYLGLNPDEIITLYKQIKIQETDLPPDALLPKQGIAIPHSLLIGLLILMIISALSVLGYFLFTNWIPKIKERQSVNLHTQEIIDTRLPDTYIITQETVEKRLFIGDSIEIPINGKNYVLSVEKVSPSLVLNTEIGKQIINLAETLKMDLDGDALSDTEILVEDTDKNNPKAGALVLIKTGKTLEPAAEEVSGIDVSSASTLPSGTAFKTLFESGSAYPVTLNATFRGYCLFRYESDKANREERYYQKAEQLTVQANNGFRIWASNGNTVKLQLVAGGKTVDLEVSRPGEVIVKDLKWIKDDTTKRFKFIITDVD